MNYREHFYSRYTTNQARTLSKVELKAKVEASMRSVASDVCPHLPRDKASKILDLGCGFGALLIHLQQNGYSHVSGVDISQEQIETAIGVGAKNVRVDTLDNALRDETVSYQAITMIDVIEHLTRNEAIEILMRIFERLETGGVLVLRTPNVDAYFGTVLSFGDLTHEMHLNKLSTQELFASLPFTSVDILAANHSDASGLARFIRHLLLPIANVLHRVRCLVYGISSSHLLTSPNMIIVARK